ncbi:hypothetical protein CAPTEDRAFT_193240 [Capitella teleta]|uniref:VWFD domain-containing protein n=1 Tax=Capitella teleta TaxID=283909 RepID=R7UPC0_CAPTE|nr:hypothetical protein CAPTEDRAFT_193240 [Capitella teleta]|eukprot:ELU05792.1 hypothetical protein CAPTEDRAFT_193240 [Capitella teleta]
MFQLIKENCCITLPLESMSDGVCKPSPVTTVEPASSETSVCTCRGDPHCEGFSIPEFLVGGSCRHVLATDNCNAILSSTFKISASFHKVKPTTATLKQGLDLSFVVEDGEDFSFQDTFTNTALPGVSALYYDNATAEFGSNWNSVRAAAIKLPNDIEIRWDGTKQVAIVMPHSFNGSLCGICGEIDSSKMTIGPHDVSHKDDNTGCPKKAASLTIGDVTEDHVEYVNSYYIEGDEDANQDCKEECNAPQTPLTFL